MILNCCNNKKLNVDYNFENKLLNDENNENQENNTAQKKKETEENENNKLIEKNK